MAVILITGGLPGTPPLALSPAHYFDFSNITKLFTDTARTTQVTADGETVKGVTNQGTSANHASEATNAPTYRTTPSPTFGGYGCIEFDGTNDILSMSTEVPFATNVDAMTVMAVHLAQTTAAESGAPSPGRVFYHHMGGSTANNAYGTSSTTVNPNYQVMAYSSGTVQFIRKACVINTPSIVTHMVQLNGQADPNLTATAYSGVTDTRTASLASGTSTTGSIGNLDNTGVPVIGSKSGTNFWDGYIVEIAIWKSILSEDNRKAVETYWGAKYGIIIPY
jgi:hypothetical protein